MTTRCSSRSLWKTGRVQTQQGRYPASLRTITRGLRLIESEADDVRAAAERARLLLGYSATRYYQGRLHAAIDHSEAAIVSARAAHDEAVLAQAHLQLGLMYSDLGDAAE